MNKLYGLLVLGLLMFGCANSEENYHMEVAPCGIECSPNEVMVGSDCEAYCITQEEFQQQMDELVDETFNLAVCINSSMPKVNALLEKYENRTIHIENIFCHRFPREEPIELTTIRSFEILAERTSNIIYKCREDMPLLLIESEDKYYFFRPYEILCNGASDCVISDESIQCERSGRTGTAHAGLRTGNKSELVFPTINMSINIAWIGVQYKYTENLTGENITRNPVSDELNLSCNDTEAFTNINGRPKCISCEGGNIEVIHYDNGVTFNCDGTLIIEGVPYESNSYSEFLR